MIPRKPWKGKELWIVHHNDLDGCCAASLAIRGTPSSLSRPTLHPINYGVEFPEPPPGVFVMLLDYTPEVEVFQRLIDRVGAENILWIDHHQTNIRRIVGLPAVLSSLSDTIPSASKLAYDFFTKASSAEVVSLVDRWDTWQHDNDPRVIGFVWGAKLMGIDQQVIGMAWNEILKLRTPNLALEAVIEDGRRVFDFDQQQMKSRLDDHGFDVQVPRLDGEPLKGRALNCGKINSFSFQSCEGHGYDVWVGFCWNGRQYSVSLYRARPDLQVHLGQYCALLGGGGHAGAAGFQTKVLPEWLCLA